MSAVLHLELLLQSSPSYAEDMWLTLPVAIHVQKRLEQFLYANTIRESAVPIAYLSNKPVSARRNLVVVNKAHSVLANSPSLFDGGKKFDIVTAKSYSSAYSSIIATSQTFVDSKGRDKPLFFRHALPENTVEASLFRYSHGNKELVDEGYLIDLDTQSIYTNYQNVHDPDSGSYRLFFVSGSISDGATFNTLLNPQPVAKEATWEDIDLNTGGLTTDYPVYSIEHGARGYSYHFNEGARWYIRAHDKGLILPRKPLADRPDAPWYLRITNGDVSAVVNGSSRRYRVTEFTTQPFIPYQPIKFGNKEDLMFVNKRTLRSFRKDLSIEPTDGLHLEIDIEDENGTLIKVYTTDTTLEGLRVSDSEVFYESDKIASWDNRNGFIALATAAFPAWKYYARFYYNADDYEYTQVNLNPITNRKLRDHTWVFYCVPDVNDADRSIHHLVVNHDGVIVECSQNQGIAHPNLQLQLDDGTYNSQTVIGLKYFSELEDNFLSRYASGFANTNGYMLLAEISCMDVSLREDMLVVDVRTPGGVIVPEFYQAAIEANPRILQSELGFGRDGQTIPQVNVVVLEPQLNLLEDYGGLLTEERAEQLLRLHMPVNGYAVIDWKYPKADISGYSTAVGVVSLDITWEGPGTYKVYRKASADAAWDLLNETSYPTRTAITYTDSGLTSDTIYYYGVAIVVDDVEYPVGNTLAVKVQ